MRSIPTANSKAFRLASLDCGFWDLERHWARSLRFRIDGVGVPSGCIVVAEAVDEATEDARGREEGKGGRLTENLGKGLPFES